MTPNQTQSDDRRQSPRTPLRRLAKVFHANTRRWLACETRDVSRGGALLWVASARPLQPNDLLDVIIARANESILFATNATPARVTRALECGDDAQLVAVEFAQQGALRAAA